jgi:hypothetical protein
VFSSAEIKPCTLHLLSKFFSSELQPRLLDIDFKILLLAGDPKSPYGLWVRGRAYGGLNIYRYLAHIHLTMGPVNPWTQPVVISLVGECIIGMEYTNSATGRVPKLMSDL